MAAEDAAVLQRVEVVAGKVMVRELMDKIKSVTQRLAFGRG